MLNRCYFLSNTPLSVAEHLATDNKWLQHAQRFSVEHNSILKSSKKGRVACLVKQSIKREADVLKANSSFSIGLCWDQWDTSLDQEREELLLSQCWVLVVFMFLASGWGCFEKATDSEHLNASLLNHIQDTNFISFWVLYRWTSKHHFYIVFQFSSEA